MKYPCIIKLINNNNTFSIVTINIAVKYKSISNKLFPIMTTNPVTKN